MRYEEHLRSNIQRLSDAYSAATGFPRQHVGRLVAGDKRFFDRIANGGFNVRSYDRAIEHFSAIWPTFVEWPGDIPRLPPVPLPPRNSDRWKAVTNPEPTSPNANPGE